MWYVKEASSIEEMLESKQLRFPAIIKKIIYSYKCIFHKVVIRQIENGYIYLIPINFKKEKINDKKTVSKMLKAFKKYNVKSVAISKYFEEKEYFKNSIYKENIHILDGRNLFNILSIDCLKYIEEKLDTKLENTEVTILVNDITDINIANIKLISKNAKIVSVISSNINKLKTIADKIYEETGTLVKLSNNTRKSLSHAKLILNVDFPEELLNKYNIYNKSILLNISGNAKVHKKSFLRNYNTIF